MAALFRTSCRFSCRVSAVPTPSTSWGWTLDLAQPKRLDSLRAATFTHTVAPSPFVCLARSLPVEEDGLAGGELRVWGAVADAGSCGRNGI